MDIYKLLRNFWDFSFANPEKIKPNHAAVYFFAIEHCNRLGWKEKFGFPTSMVLEATGIKSYSVFKKTFDDLIEYGFIKIIEYSKNQYSSNIIALKENCKAHSKADSKALDKALTKHRGKQSESTMQSTGESTESIDIQIYNNTNIQVYRSFAHLSLSQEEFEKLLSFGYSSEQVDGILDEIENKPKLHKNYKSLFLTAKNWLKKEKGSGEKEKKKSNLELNMELTEKLMQI